jgi:hypothetical protein
MKTEGWSSLTCSLICLRRHLWCPWPASASEGCAAHQTDANILYLAADVWIMEAKVQAGRWQIRGSGRSAIGGGRLPAPTGQVDDLQVARPQQMVGAELVQMAGGDPRWWPPAGLRRRQALRKMRAAVRLSVLQFMRKKTKMSANLE